MGIVINALDVKKDVNKLSFKLIVCEETYNNRLQKNKDVSEEFTIDSASGSSVLCQVKVKKSVDRDYGEEEIKLFIRITKKNSSERIYVVKCTQKCDEVTSKDRYFTTDDGSWRLIDDCPEQFTYGNSNTIIISLEIIGVVNGAFAPSCEYKFLETLRNDTELTDFELRGVDGSVHLHRAVAAAHSPVFKTMFEGTWRETKEGAIEVKDTSKNTLQHLKDYMYLGQIPDTGLEQLLLLAVMYMMPDLRLRCVNKLKMTVTQDSVCDLTKFAVNHHLSDLLVEIFRQVENGKANIKNIETESMNVN